MARASPIVRRPTPEDSSRLSPRLALSRTSFRVHLSLPDTTRWPGPIDPSIELDLGQRSIIGPWIMRVTFIRGPLLCPAGPAGYGYSGLWVPDRRDAEVRTQHLARDSLLLLSTRLFQPLSIPTLEEATRFSSTCSLTPWLTISFRDSKLKHTNGLDPLRSRSTRRDPWIWTLFSLFLDFHSRFVSILFRKLNLIEG